MKPPRTLWQINSRNIILKCRLSGLQHCPWQYGFTLIRLAAVACQICKLQRNSPKIRTYSSSRSSKVIDLVANRKRICNFLLIINGNFGRTSYRFPDIDAFSSNISHFRHPTLVRRLLAEERPVILTQPIHRWKVHLMGYNSVAHSTGLSSFV